MNEVSGKNKTSRIILIISIICLIGIGLSFGYYLISRGQDENNVAGSKCFKLELTNQSKEITLDTMYPISDEEGRSLSPYSFTITNTCDMLAGYTVNMEMLENTTLNSKYVDVMVNNEEIKLLTKYDETSTVITGSTESRILAKGTLAYNDSVDYTVRFWMDKDVEDVDSMNKYFTSKIVIQATPSSWNPKDAGYDTLHDAILANEYQTTPEIAKNMIVSKQSVDVSQTAPVIKWLEKSGISSTRQVIKPTADVISSANQFSNLSTDEQYMYVCTTKSFNSETARYSLGNCSLQDPTKLNYSGDTKYYYSMETMEYSQTNSKMIVSRNFGDTVAYQITGATKTIGTRTTGNITYEANIYNLLCITLTKTELETAKSDKGLYEADDDYGTTYYYRGNIANNNVYFANLYWQIVRINGDGSIRLIYNGTTKNATGDNQVIDTKTYQFNSKYNDPAYVGYMYGNPDGTTFDEVHANTNNSTVKSIIDDWYKVNIVDKGYSNFVSNAVGFCGDRTLSSGDGISASSDSYFGAYGRSKQNTAQFTCPNIERDLYTTTDALLGNKALTYPVGLITYDEMVFAGIDQKHINKMSWIYSSQPYWSITPCAFNTTWGDARNWNLHNAGNLNPWWGVNYSLGVRPVINLKSDVKISKGVGTANDPYHIKE